MEVKRGDVLYLVDCAYFGQIGNYQGGVRPLLVVSNNKGNHFSNICIVCPLTSSRKRSDLPTHAKIRNGTALCEQLFTIQKENILRIVDHLPDEQMKRVDESLKSSLELG